MATFLKRGKKYQVQIRRKGLAPISKTFYLKSDAEEWARFMESKADRGELPTSTKVLHQITLGNLLERYRDEISIKKRGASIEAYIINAILRQSFANLTLAQITPSHFINYRNTRLQTVKPATVNRELGIIQHAFDVGAKDWNLPISNNPLFKVSKPKVQNARKRRLLECELELLEKAASTNRNSFILPLIKFALETGMRRGELLNLKWNDINSSGRTLHIPVTKNGHARTIFLCNSRKYFFAENIL